MCKIRCITPVPGAIFYSERFNKKELHIASPPPHSLCSTLLFCTHLNVKSVLHCIVCRVLNRLLFSASGIRDPHKSEGNQSVGFFFLGKLRTMPPLLSSSAGPMRQRRGSGCAAWIRCNSAAAVDGGTYSSSPLPASPPLPHPSFSIARLHLLRCAAAVARCLPVRGFH